MGQNETVFGPCEIVNFNFYVLFITFQSVLILKTAIKFSQKPPKVFSKFYLCKSFNNTWHSLIRKLSFF